MNPYKTMERIKKHIKAIADNPNRDVRLANALSLLGIFWFTKKETRLFVSLGQIHTLTLRYSVEAKEREFMIGYLNRILDALEDKKIPLLRVGKNFVRKPVLDLSNHPTTQTGECLDLAKNVHSILHDPRTPEKVVSALQSALDELPQPSFIPDAVEYIAATLCNEKQ